MTPKITESQINTADVKEIFNTAADQRNSPSIRNRILKLRKGTVDISDLQAAWKDKGYPDDTRDITAILTNYGFSKKEIKKVYDTVFGRTDTKDTDLPTQSPTIQKITDYANKNNLKQELIDFMRAEYKFTDPIGSPNKAVVEDVRKIFSLIVSEAGSDREGLIKQYESTHLGRSKK